MLIPFESHACTARTAVSKEAAEAIGVTTLHDAMLRLVLEQNPGLRDQILAAVASKIQEAEQREKQNEDEHNVGEHEA